MRLCGGELSKWPLVFEQWHRQLWNVCKANENGQPFHADIILTQQQAVTVIWTTFRPAWTMSFKLSGLWRCLASPRSMTSGVELTDTWTAAGQLGPCRRSSWWKHFSCSSRSGRQSNVSMMLCFSWNIWWLTERLCSKRNGAKMMPSRSG